MFLFCTFHKYFIEKIWMNIDTALHQRQCAKSEQELVGGDMIILFSHILIKWGDLLVSTGLRSQWSSIDRNMSGKITAAVPIHKINHWWETERWNNISCVILFLKIVWRTLCLFVRPLVSLFYCMCMIPQIHFCFDICWPLGGLHGSCAILTDLLFQALLGVERLKCLVVCQTGDLTKVILLG